MNLAAALFLASPLAAGDAVEILARRCVECHGPEKHKGELRLDRAEFAARAIVPGAPEESELFRRLLSSDPEDRMPRGAAALDAGEIETLRAWIAAGAPWPESSGAARAHWAYQPLRRPAPPSLRDASGARNPIDLFVRARLEREGLAPAPEADRRTLLRRLALDLTGLPPTPEELRAFLDDARPDAYERCVERLLASPHYGERMALPWLDLARYADTNGYEKDARRTHWPWRDWVIDAFNSDLPYDRFTLEQVAGDLIPGASLRQRLATGFQRNTLVNQEGGTDPEEFRHAALVDRVNTTATVWLGTTLACAQCHNHKYDPFTQRDYFRFLAYFDQSSDTGNREEPLLRVPDAADEARARELEQALAARERLLELGDAQFEGEQRDWERAARAAALPAADWSLLRPLSARARSAAALAIRADGSVLASGENPAEEEYTLEFEAPRAELCELRLELLPDASLPAGSSGRAANGNFELDEVVAEIQRAGMRLPLPFVAAHADREQADVRARAALAIDGDPTSFWAAGAHQERGPHALELVLATAAHFSAGDRLILRLQSGRSFAQHNLGCLRLSAGADARRAARLVPALDARRGWELVGPYPAQSELPPTIDWRPEQAQPAGNLRPIRETQARWSWRRSFAAPRAQRLRLFLGADDSLRVTLDGRLVYARLDYDPVLPDAHQLELELAAGAHRIECAVVNGGGPGGFYLDAVRADVLPDSIEALLERPEDSRSAEERGVLARFHRRSFSARGRALADEIAALRAERSELEARTPTALVLEERAERRVTHLHRKGAFLDLGEEVTPGTPASLPACSAAPRADRLGLALWLVDPANPLVARVQANRVWETLLGRGLVATSEDFGTRGAPPTHPELLDWLACELVGGGWSVKHLVRTIVLSATYRQSSRVPAGALERDPEAALLSRAPRPRLSGELLRDNALAIAGILEARLGGPSVFPPQPEGVWAPVYSDDRWLESKGGDRLRRGLYTFWKRSSPYASFQLFDAPSREACCPRRARSDTPLQALALLNDPAYLECAEALARRMRALESSDEARLCAGFERCTARLPEGRELEALARLLGSERAQRGEDAAWLALANVLLNLDETLTRP